MSLPITTTSDIKKYLDRAEAGDAELFAFHFRDKYVYDRSEKKWYFWEEHYWTEDKLGLARRAVVTTVACDYAAAGADALGKGNNEWARAFSARAEALMTRKRADAVLALTADIPGMSVTGDEWDKHPDLLAAKNGVINLRTGKLEEGRPNLYMRCHLNCSYKGLAEYSPDWNTFISQFCEGIVIALGGNPEEVIKFMRRLLGYFITGEVREKILPIMWGEHGYNGRTTLQEALRSVLGHDFIHTVTADVLMKARYSDRSGPQPHMYALRGKRAVFAAESRDGQTIDSGVVKQLTGMDSFETHGKYTAIVTVNPTFKVALLTNKKPHIDVGDDALWRRILLIPFAISYVDEPSKQHERKADKDLPDKLKKAGPAILAWLVMGAVEWYQEGLHPPRELLAVTREYRSEEDEVRQFVEEGLVLNAATNTRAQEIYQHYARWAESNGLKPISNVKLGKRLRELLGEPQRDSKGKFYKNVMPRQL